MLYFEKNLCVLLSKVGIVTCLNTVMIHNCKYLKAEIIKEWLNRHKNIDTVHFSEWWSGILRVNWTGCVAGLGATGCRPSDPNIEVFIVNLIYALCHLHCKWGTGSSDSNGFFSSVFLGLIIRMELRVFLMTVTAVSQVGALLPFSKRSKVYITPWLSTVLL